MATETIEQRVIAVIQEVLRVDKAKIIPTSRIKEDLGADSLDQVSVIMALEEEFEGSLSDDEAKGLVTVGDAVKFIEEKWEFQTV
jgi:acyl carrier protein